MTHNSNSSYYLSTPGNIEQALADTGLAADELEAIVGRFTAHSHRAGQLRGEIVHEYERVVIRHHFTKKVLWTSDL